VAESARLESVCGRKTILGSNPSPTAKNILKVNELDCVIIFRKEKDG
jgi:hypothetical protein